MALCTSGSLSICAAAGTCRSIEQAVTSTQSGSLSTLSVAAGKAAPHSMLEFYGYSESVNVPVRLTHVSSIGTTSCLMSITTPRVSSCYNLTIEFRGVGQGKTSENICIMCNGVCKYGCLNPDGIGNFPTFLVTCATAVCICTKASAFLVDDWSNAEAHIETVTTGSGSIDTYTIGSPNFQCSWDGIPT